MIKDGSFSGSFDPTDLFDLADAMRATYVHGVSRQIRERRLALGLSQAELADKSKVSQATISKLELGEECNPTFQTVKSVAVALGLFATLELVTVEVLLAKAEAYEKGVV